NQGRSLLPPLSARNQIGFGNCPAARLDVSPRARAAIKSRCSFDYESPARLALWVIGQRLERQAAWVEEVEDWLIDRLGEGKQKRGVGFQGGSAVFYGLHLGRRDAGLFGKLL